MLLSSYRQGKKLIRSMPEMPLLTSNAILGRLYTAPVSLPYAPPFPLFADSESI